MGIQSRPAVGINARIVLGNETNQGEPAVGLPLDRKICFTTEALGQTENVLESATICGCGSSRGRNRESRGSLDVGGDISVEFAPQEYGRLIRHSLGDYVLLPDVDGTSFGVAAFGAEAGSPPSGFVFKNYAVGFEETGGDYVIVYRDDNGVLKVDDNGGSYYDYDAFTPYVRTTAQANAGPVGPTDTITLDKGADGEMLLDPGAGVWFFQIEIDGVYYVVNYTSLVDNGADFDVDVVGIVRGKISPGVDVFSLPAVPSLTAIPAGAPVYQLPALYDADVLTGFSDPDYKAGASEVDSGVYIYKVWEEAVSYPGAIYTHHFEIAEQLPPGLTIDILRDTVNFVYSGCMVNEWTVTFDSQAYVTSSWTMIGIAEYSVVSLAREAKVGDTVIYLNEEPVAFPMTGGGTLTIGEEQQIRFTTITSPALSSSGLWEVSGIPSSGIESIQMTHLIGENVDSNVVATDNSFDCDEVPRFTSYEAVVAMNYELIEVLNGSITLNNNIGGDKFMLGSRYRAALREGRAQVSGSITVEFDDGQHYKKFIKGEYFELQFRALSDDPEFVNRLGVYAPISTTFYLPSCKYTGTTPSVQDDSYLNTDMPFNAFDDKRTSQVGASLVVVATNYSNDDGQ